MIDIIVGIGVIGFFIGLVLVVNTLIKKNGLLKRNSVLMGSFLLITMLGLSLEDGLNGIFTFIGILGFLAVGVFVGMIIYSATKKTGQTKKYAKLIFIPLLVMIIGLANSDNSSEAALDQNKNNDPEELEQVKDKKEDNDKQVTNDNVKKDKEEQDKETKNKKEAEQLKEKEQTEKVDRDKKDEEAKQVTKDNDEKDQAGKFGQLKVHYIDVGQADATLLEITEDGKQTTMLIDAGDWNRTDALDYLKAINITDIDVVVGTHPHADHIGQLDKILNTFKVDEVWMSGDLSSSQVFQRALQAIDSSGANYLEPRAGESYQIGNLAVDIVSPSTIGGGLNDGSIAMRITYGGVSFLFTGDAETKAEQGMVSRGDNLTADILHLGHHGSDTSTIPAFFDKVKPKVAIYSASSNNSYGHPSPSVVERVNKANVDLYGTDVHGTIILTTDGKTYNISTSKQGTVTASKETAKEEAKPKPTTKPESKPTPKQPAPKPATPKPETKPTPKPDNKPAPKPETKPKEPVASAGCIDINTASKEQLETIIHIGPERSELLIQGRPYSSVENLTNIKGIAAGRLADIIDQGAACVN